MTTIVAVLGRGGGGRADPPTSNHPNPSTGLVLAPTHDNNNNTGFNRAVRLLDPSGEEERLYLVGNAADTTTSSSKEVLSHNNNTKPHHRNDGNGPKNEEDGNHPTITQLYELVQVNDDDGYTSMLLTPNLVVNQPLCTVTPVDPLFWVLSAACPVPLSSSSVTTETSSPPRKWQPLGQLLAGVDLPSVVRSSLDRSQLPHLFQKMNLGDGGSGTDNDNDDDDDSYYYKFCETRALSWLSRKRDAVRAGLVLQQCQSVADGDPHGSTDVGQSGDGAFDSTFRPSGDLLLLSSTTSSTSSASEAPATAVPEPTPDHLTRSPADAKLAQCIDDESVQIVCQYLAPQWRDAFLRHLQLPRAALEGRSRPSAVAVAPPTTVSPSSSVASEGGSGSFPAVVPPTGPTAAAAATPAVRRPAPPPILTKKPKLKESDARGTHKLTNFFTAKKKTKQ